LLGHGQVIENGPTGLVRQGMENQVQFVRS